MSRETTNTINQLMTLHLKHFEKSFVFQQYNNVCEYVVDSYPTQTLSLLESGNNKSTKWDLMIINSINFLRTQNPDKLEIYNRMLEVYSNRK